MLTIKLKPAILGSALAALIAAATMAWPGAALAQNKVTKLIVAFPPGGPVDIVARLIADPMSKDLGQSIIVDNKPGGGTIIAAAAISAAKADPRLAGLSLIVSIRRPPVRRFMGRYCCCDGTENRSLKAQPDLGRPLRLPST